jgi:hypothetical protein
MKVYKVIFAKNEIISCTEMISNASLVGLYHYEQNKGQLIYALINAELDQDAYIIATTIIKEVSEHN